MAYPFTRFMKYFKPVRNAPLLVVVIFLIFGTFIMSMVEIASLERRIRERMKHMEMKHDFTEPVETFLVTKPKQQNNYNPGHSEKNTKLRFPLPRFHAMRNATAKGSVKTMTWLFPPKWVSSDSFFSHCRESLCRVSFKASDIPVSDVILVEGRHDRLGIMKPPLRMPGQIYVFFMMEPPSYVNVSREWTNVFNWTISYRRDSDIWRPYGELRPNGTQLSEEYFQNVLKKKKKTVAWIVSRCVSHGLREKYVKELSKYVNVDIFGRCGPVKCGTNCTQMLESYYFYLSFENSLCKDYVTEKFFRTFKYDIVPIVRGGADYPNHFNNKAFINTADFKSIEDLGKHLNYLMKNNMAYIDILKEKHRYYAAYPVPWCDLCHQIHNAEDYTQTVNIHDWLDKGKCVVPRDV